VSTPLTAEGLLEMLDSMERDDRLDDVVLGELRWGAGHRRVVPLESLRGRLREFIAEHEPRYTITAKGREMLSGVTPYQAHMNNPLVLKGKR
jgi:hypothetical protein